VGLGDLLLLLNAFCWAVHIMLISRFAPRVQPLRYSTAQFLTCGILSLVCALIFENITAAALSDGLWAILYAGFMSVGVAYTLQIFGQRGGVAPEKAAVIFSLEALFAALGGSVLLNEHMTSRAYTGCAFIFAGIIASQIVVRPRSNPT
jgi:drug/metabolite transporter (DMT)-like permease